MKIKKILALLLALAMVLALAACGGDNGGQQTDNPPPAANNDADQPSAPADDDTPLQRTWTNRSALCIFSKNFRAREAGFGYYDQFRVLYLCELTDS